MRKNFYYFLFVALLFLTITGCNSNTEPKDSKTLPVQTVHEDEEGYDGPAARDMFEFERIKDPRLGYVPTEKMLEAIDYTEKLKTLSATGRTKAFNWIERGPIYDTVGTSNGNIRGTSRTSSGTYTSGRTRAILVDTLNDPTGNTVFCGSVAGGLWKCTNFLSAVPNWQVINDRFDNLAISYICQDPSNPSVMYFSTGEPTGNSDAVSGAGIWRSSDKGITWTRLPSTHNFVRTFRLLCDADGNIYLAARTTSVPVIQTAGLLRSKDQGATWENITPGTLTSSNASCTDIELTSTGKLHASFGYLGTRVQHIYTTIPTTVTRTAGWNASTGIRVNTSVGAYRMELAARADTLYAVTSNTSGNLDSCYKSIDGGVSWTQQNTSALSASILGGQGWYNLTLEISPTNTQEFIVGGIDAFRSTNSGATIATRVTYWVNGNPYVHADHHFMQWRMVGTQSRIIIGCDGGVFISNDGGATFTDKNRNLAIKQFYDAGIHPGQGVNYIIAGAQDNGTHQLKNAGLSYSTEVTGGDGCFVHINQQNPQIQFATYVYNQYRRSVNGGETWTPINLSSTRGAFVNQYDYDGGQNILYASWAGPSGAPNRQILRWKNAHISNTDTSILTIPELTTTGTNTSNNATVLKVSPYTRDRVFIGGNKGAIVRLDNASSVTNANVSSSATTISGADFDTGYVSCVNIGSSDNFLVATFSSYGVKHVWFSSNGGTSWINIDGTPGSGGLPDMPVRWAIFDPQSNNKLILATEAGVYTTDAINGANTVWTADVNFPTVRTDMLRLRLSDNTIVAATHGRGVFTAILASTPEVRFNAPFITYREGTTSAMGCRNYTDYTVDVSMISAPTGDATVTYNVQGGGSALEGTDFDFTTNGDFGSPSKQQVFNNGVISAKTITVRVYDDAEQEAAETFVITFNITGSTNAIVGSANTFTITVNDNDLSPLPYVFNGMYVTDTGSATTASAGPFRSDRLKHRVQTLYTATELRSAGILFGGNITALKLKVISKNSTRPFNGFRISMANSPTTNLNTAYGSGTLTTVWTGDYTSVQGDNNFSFTTPFVWDGVSNVLVQYCFDNSSATFDSTAADVVEASVPDTTIYHTIYSNHTTSTSAGCLLTASSISTTRITATFTATFGTPVATALNTSRTEYFKTTSATNNFYYYTSTGQVLAGFKNTSVSDYGCTEVVIDRAGTGATKLFSDTDSSTFLMDKTYRILPTSNNSSGTSEITFYFSKTEKEGWEAVTKQSFNNIKVIKVSGQISSVTPSNPNGAGAVEVINPISVGSLGENYFITAVVTTGFSGFGFGLPYGILPVTSLTFTGKLQGDNALLTWNTTSEQNTKTFEVEKSFDGITYRKIGEVRAAGNSNSKRTYSLLDRELAFDINYYRLVIVDNDNKAKKTSVVVLKNTAKQQGMVVVNNPFREYIDVRFRKIPEGRIKLQLTDLSGRLIHSETFSAASQTLLRFSLRSKTLSKGVYMLSADTDGNRYTTRVLKQ